jgi:branched-chain amino acid transport system substrate-binding protein
MFCEPSDESQRIKKFITQVLYIPSFKVEKMSKKGITTTMAAVSMVALLIVGIVIGFVVFPFAFPGGVPWAPAELTGEVTIGSLQPLTGDLATYGANSKVAIEFAAKEVNDFLNKSGAAWTLKILSEDSETKPDVALAKLESFNAKGIKFVIGPMSSGEVSNLKSYADSNKILVVSQSSTAPALGIKDDFIFRFCPTDFIQGPAIARLMYDAGIRYVVVVWRGDAWGDGLEGAAEARFEQLGGTFIETAKIRYAPEATEFSTEATSLRDKVTSALADPAINETNLGVLYIGFEEAVAFFTAARAHSTNGWGVKWYGSDGTVQSSKMILDTTVADFSYKTNFTNPIFAPTISDKYQKVLNKVNATLGRVPDSYAYAAYDIVWALAYSLMTVDRYDGEAVKAVLPEVTKSLFGAAGWTVLNDAGDRASADYELWVIVKVGATYDWKKVGTYVASTDSIVWL